MIEKNGYRTCSECGAVGDKILSAGLFTKDGDGGFSRR